LLATITLVSSPARAEPVIWDPRGVTTKDAKIIRSFTGVAGIRTVSRTVETSQIWLWQLLSLILPSVVDR
jgi:hypothetical protein